MQLDGELQLTARALVAFKAVERPLLVAAGDERHRERKVDGGGVHVETVHVERVDERERARVGRLDLAGLVGAGGPDQGQLRQPVQAEHERLHERALQRLVGVVELPQRAVGVGEQDVCPRVDLERLLERLHGCLRVAGREQQARLDDLRDFDVGGRFGVALDPAAQLDALVGEHDPFALAGKVKVVHVQRRHLRD